MKNTLVLSAIALSTALAASAPAATTFSGAGNLAAATAVRDSFRTALGGGTTAGANGDFGGLRREINWDGTPDASSAPNNLPANFFNVNSPRGVVFSTTGTAVQVSANSGVAPVEFDNINPGYSSLFAPFSTQRLFTPISSNTLDVNFFLPGTSTPALTRGFGAVFSDVDLANTTSIEFFDVGNVSLGKFFAPAVAGANETFSFLGVDFGSATVSRVRILSGNIALGAGVSESANIDLVVMDDFLYGTPVPEPGTIGVLVLASTLLLRRRHSS